MNHKCLCVSSLNNLTLINNPYKQKSKTWSGALQCSYSGEQDHTFLNMFASSSKVHLIVLAAIIQLMLSQRVEGKSWGGYIPAGSESSNDDKRPTYCEQPEIKTLCQLCAKHTKSNIVYPMCCKELEEAREFCRRYLDYGLQS